MHWEQKLIEYKQQTKVTKSTWLYGCLNKGSSASPKIRIKHAITNVWSGAFIIKFELDLKFIFVNVISMLRLRLVSTC